MKCEFTVCDYCPMRYRCFTCHKTYIFEDCTSPEIEDVCDALMYELVERNRDEYREEWMEYVNQYD